MKYRSLAIIVIIASTTLSLLGPLPNVFALPGGASWDTGYFFGKSLGSAGLDALLNHCGGTTPFDSTMTDKTRFVNRVVSYYTGGCSAGRNSIGARFIMLTMLDRSASAPRSSGANLINDWTAYINGSNIGIKWMTNLTFNYNSGCYSNSGCDNGGEDEYFINADRNGDSLVFYTIGNNKPIYALKLDCGNPVGYSNIILPPPVWSITPTSIADRVSAKPGETITWTHAVKNDGLNATNKPVTYHYQNRQDLVPINGTGSNNTFPSGSANGASNSFKSTYLVVPSDAGKTLCRATSASPKSSSDPGWIESPSPPTPPIPSNCVLILTPSSWSITPTISVNTPTAKPGDTITWIHTVKNNGPNTTTKNVTYHYQNHLGLGEGHGSDLILQIGFGSNKSVQFPSIYKVVQSDIGKNLCRATSASPKSSSDSGWIESVSACVTVSISIPPPVSNDCNPIKVALAQPTTYPAVSHTDPRGRSYYTGPNLVPVRVSINSTTIGTYTTATTINLTTNYTTGDAYTVNFKETTNHVIGYTDNYKTRGSEIMDTSAILVGYKNGSEIMDTSRKITGYTKLGVPIYNYGPRSFSPKKYNQIPVYNYGPRSFVPKKYNWLYSDTTTNYSDGATSSNTSGGASLPNKSIGPCYDYTLTANIGTSFGNKVEPGATVFINPLVGVSPYRTYITHSMNSEWRIIKMVVQPNTQLSAVSGGISSSDPCNYFDPGNIADCSTQASNGSTVFSAAGTPSVSTSSTYTAPDSLAGTKICFAFSVRARAGWDRSSTDDRWSNAAFDPINNCIIIVKKPKVQIWGGDLWSGNFVSGSTSTKNNNTFGSWVEYGIFARGIISGVASGSAFAGQGLANATNSPCSYSTLSFTNVPVGGSNCTGNSGTIGNYANSRSIPDVSASFQITAGTPLATSNLDNLQGVYTANGLTINGGNIKKGQWIVINAPKSDITISGNITYTNEVLSKATDIPQVVIIANNINIADNVTNIDAWLIAKSNINTCSTVSQAAPLTVNECNQPLLVNGPVMAQKLFLRRTAGSGKELASGDPAEVFNLRADAYIWATLRAGSSGRIQTVYVTELPPRF